LLTTGERAIHEGGLVLGNVHIQTTGDPG
jgi:hypothetical protein